MWWVQSPLPRYSSCEWCPGCLWIPAWQYPVVGMDRDWVLEFQGEQWKALLGDLRRAVGEWSKKLFSTIQGELFYSNKKNGRLRGSLSKIHVHVVGLLIYKQDLKRFCTVGSISLNFKYLYYCNVLFCKMLFQFMISMEEIHCQSPRLLSGTHSQQQSPQKI